MTQLAKVDLLVGEDLPDVVCGQDVVEGQILALGKGGQRVLEVELGTVFR